MTQTISADQTSETACRPLAEPSIAVVEPSINIIVALLTRVFLGVTGGDPDLARLAATQALASYGAGNFADQLAAAQIAAFGLAAMESIRLSMADDISRTARLRLVGSANACDRAAEKNRRQLREFNPDPPAVPEIPTTRSDEAARPTAFSATRPRRQAKTAREAAPHAPVAVAVTVPEPEPVEPISDERHRQMWATVMTQEADNIIARMPTLPPDERDHAALEATALREAADDILALGNGPRLSLAAAFAGIA